MILEPFWPLGAGPGGPIKYRSVRAGAQLVVTGTATRRPRDGSPLLTTRAVLSPANGIEEIEIEISARGRRQQLTRMPA